MKVEGESLLAAVRLPSILEQILSFVSQWDSPDVADKLYYRLYEENILID